MGTKHRVKLTGWFPPYIKPLASRPGVYETQYDRADLEIAASGYRGWSYWSGQRWGPQTATKQEAETLSFLCGTAYQSKRWRGAYREEAK